MAVLFSCIWLLGFLVSLFLTIRFVTVLVAAAVLMIRDSLAGPGGRPS